MSLLRSRTAVAVLMALAPAGSAGLGSLALGGPGGRLYGNPWLTHFSVVVRILLEFAPDYICTNTYISCMITTIVHVNVQLSRFERCGGEKVCGEGALRMRERLNACCFLVGGLTGSG